MASGRAAITGLGANTSLGATVQACAAIRGRLSRPAALPASSFDSEEGDAPVTGHAVPAVAGFQGEARLLSLALPALRELQSSAGVGAIPEVALCVALPDLGARARAAGEPVPPKLRLLDRMVHDAALAVAPEARFEFPAGPAGFALAVGAALELLARGGAAACIVGGVDTFCDVLGVRALAAEGRLKSGDNPVGVQPGEAAAFLLMEAPAAARRRKAGVLANMAGTGVAQEPAKDSPAQGVGLATAVRQLKEGGGPLPPGETWFILDRNGETGRASDWGYCQQRLLHWMPGLFPAPEWDPAASLGDTGAASGAVAALAAVRGFVRSYAPGRSAVVLSSSDDGRRAAIRVERAE